MINRLYKLREKRAKFLNHLHFLLECKRSRILPSFLHLHCNLQSSGRVQRALQRCRFILLRAVIQDTRANLAKIEQELYLVHLQLGRKETLNESQFNFHERRSWNHAARVSDLHRFDQQKKMAILRSKNVSKPAKSDFSTSIVNLSDIKLTDTHKRVLDLGFNFAVAKKLHVPKLIAPIENSVSNSKISPGQKDALRYLIADTIASNSTSAKHNLTKEEKRALRELQSNDEIVITRADKGGKTVILPKEKYVTEVESLLNEGPYIQLKRDPLNVQKKEVHMLVKKMETFPDSKKNYIVSSNAVTPRFYALPKVHKPTLSFRPIVSKINSPAYHLSKYLVSIFSTLRSSNCHTVKNSREFVTKLQAQPSQDVTMLSFDVKSLFTCVPLDGAIRCLRHRLIEFHFTSTEIEELLTLTEICLKQNSFVFNNKIYQQTSGLAMGDPLSPVLSDIYMHYFECQLLSKISFQFYVRYVDDTFVLWTGQPSKIPEILGSMNSIDPNIQFTVEQEENHSISFLDVFVTRTDNGFHTKVYRKDCSISRPPHQLSNHTNQQKSSAFISFVHRAMHICSDTRSYNEELHHLRDIAISRGFTQQIIDQAIRKINKRKAVHSTLEPIDHHKHHGTVFLPLYQNLSYKIAAVMKKFHFKVIFEPIGKISPRGIKDPVPHLLLSGIYSIPCECEKQYIGQTKRYLKQRISEHKQYVKKQELTKSSIARHCWEQDHQFKFMDAKIISPCRKTEYLNSLESYYIHSNIQNLVNDESSIPPLSTAWKYLITSLPARSENEI